MTFELQRDDYSGSPEGGVPVDVYVRPSPIHPRVRIGLSHVSWGPHIYYADLSLLEVDDLIVALQYHQSLAREK